MASSFQTGASVRAFSLYAASAPTLQCAPSESTNCARTPPKSCFFGGHGEQNAPCAHVPVECLDICDTETQFDLSCWILPGRRMQREGGFSRREFAPPGDSNFSGSPSTSR